MTVFCQEGNFGGDFSLRFRRTTQQVLEIQLDTPLWRNASEEAVFVEAGLGQATDEVTHGQSTVPQLSFQFRAPLEIHHVGVAKNLSI